MKQVKNDVFMFVIFLSFFFILDFNFFAAVFMGDVSFFFSWFPFLFWLLL